MSDIEPFTTIRTVDVETTGMEGAEVVEIGWTDVRFYPGEGWALESGPHSILCGHTVPMEPEARAAHHITDEELEGRAPFTDIVSEIYEDADYFAAHNAEFDSQFFPDKRVPFLCTMKIASAIYPDFPSHGNQALRYRLGLEFDDIEKTLPAHRAGPDSYVTAVLLIHLLNYKGAKGVPYPMKTMLKTSEQPRRFLRWKFGKHRGELLSDTPTDYLRWIIDKSDMDDGVKWNVRRELEARGLKP